MESRSFPYTALSIIGRGGVNVKIVIPQSFSRTSIHTIARTLYETFHIGLGNICLCPGYLIKRPELLEENIGQVFTKCMAARELISFSYITQNDCNLTCKACTTCSPLVKNTDKVSIAQYEKDIDRMRELFDNVKTVSFQGGECLLDEDLMCHAITYFKEAFPYTEDIHIRTNGTLLMAMKESTISCLRENNVLVDISLYAPFLNKIDTIVGFLQNHGIKYDVYYAEKFTKRISLETVHDKDVKSLECRGYLKGDCLQLQAGMMSRCPFPRAISFFNSQFGSSLPTDGEFDIHDKSLTTEEFHRKLLKPIGFCGYCHMGETQHEFTHSMGKGAIKLEDWIVGGTNAL